eukprot:2728253-Prymnesium_polylepis.1
MLTRPDELTRPNELTWPNELTRPSRGPHEALTWPHEALTRPLVAPSRGPPTPRASFAAHPLRWARLQYRHSCSRSASLER